MSSSRTLFAWLLAVGAATASSCLIDWDSIDPDSASELSTSSSTGGGVTTTSTTSSTTTTTGQGGIGGAGGSAGGGGAGGDGHVTNNLIALYTFDEGSGDTVGDVSGVGVALDLTIADLNAVTWIAGGLEVTSSTIVNSPGPATKIIDACKLSNELSLSIWVTPQNLTQTGPARLVTNSADSSERNFQLGQLEDIAYQARFRTTLGAGGGGVNGYPPLGTPDSAGDVTLTLTNVSFTRDAAGERVLYVNGVARANDVLGGDVSGWDDTFQLALANEFISDRTWLGQYYRLAIYDRALTAAEVMQNFNAGP